jgi:hypothetical protein
VIKLLGRNPFEMTRLEHYADVDPGYVVTDNYYPASQITVTVDTSELNTQVGGNYYVYYRATDPSGNRSILEFRAVRVKFMTSLNDNTVISNAKISVYPNPSTGTFFINTNEEIQQLDVMNMTGQLVKSIRDYNSTDGIRIDNKGIYMLRILGNNSLYYHKVIVD